MKTSDVTAAAAPPATPDRIEVAAAAAASLEVRGRVVHEDGRASPGASVYVGTLDGEEHAEPTFFRWVSADNEGRFAVPHVPVGVAIEIVATVHIDDTHLGGERRLELATSDEFEVVLDFTWDDEPTVIRSPPQAITVTGHVLHHDGRTAAGALVFTRDRSRGVTADDHGRFEYPVPLLEPGADPKRYDDHIRAMVLHAAHPDGGLVRAENFGPALAANLPSPPAPIELQLPGPHARLVGRLVKANGQPPADWEVWLQSPTWSGGMTSASIAETWWAKSDAVGQFALAELDPSRTYHLAVRSPDGAIALTSGPHQPSLAPIEIVVDDRAFAHDVAGTAVGLRGEPLSGVTLALRTTLTKFGKTAYEFRQHDDWGECTTDSAGRFRFARVPVGGASVVAKSSDQRRFTDVEAHLDPDALHNVLTFEPLVPFRPLVADPTDPDIWVGVIDDNDNQMDMWNSWGRFQSWSFAINHKNNPDPALWVSARGRYVVLQALDVTLGSSTELTRAPLPPWPGPESGPLPDDLGGR
ncbi:MAG: hypothetical protein GC161_15055 [Planctomycetaceae bacterium]|nr:hypothetical protein [Planctomycetaceae bacterium]